MGGSVKSVIVLVLLAVLILPAAVLAGGLEAALADPAWNGRSVPSGQQCTKFGGSGAAPALQVSGIPAQADALVLSFGDKDYSALSDGGHGVVSYAVTPGAGSVTVPALPGETFDLPAGFTLIHEHRGWSRPGAYLPPCSGGKSHLYIVTVKAVKLGPAGSGAFEELDKTKVKLGYY